MQIRTIHALNETDRSYFSTRLCVRNLPKDAIEDDIRNWLLKGRSDMQITDCRVLHKGKQSLAFVGMSSAEHADEMIQQYNRTYYRTSRVVVERAFKSPKLHAVTSDKVSDGNAAPAKDTETKPKNEKPKVSTLVAAGAATASQSVKFWANDVVGGNSDVNN